MSPFRRLFSSAVERCPAAPAVMCPQGTLSFSQLKDRAERAVERDERGRPVLIAGGTDPLESVTRLVGAWLAQRPFTLGAHDAPRPLLLDASEDPTTRSNVFATSGTTGSPKLVVHSDQTLLAGLLSTIRVQAELLGTPVPTLPALLDGAIDDARSGMVLASAMHPTTIAGYTMVQRALLLGDCVAFASPSNPSLLLQQLTQHRANAVSLPSLVASTLARHIRLDARPAPPDLLSIGIGGSLVSPETAEVLESRLGAVVTAGYGSTELGGPALMARPTDPPSARWGSVGTPLPGIEVRLERAEGCDGETELWVKRPSLALGVLEGGRRSPIGVDGWFGTGDAASMGADGRVRVAGRIDGVLLRGGRRHDLTQIEQHLLAVDGVQEAAAFAVPSRVPGETDLAGLVVLEGRAAHMRPSDIRRRFSETGPGDLPPLRRLAIVAELPRATDGNLSIAGARRIIDAGR